MKKVLLSAGMLVALTASAQTNPAPQKLDTNHTKRIGFNTQTPQASMEVKELLNGNIPIDARIQGISLPNFTTEQRSKFGEGQTESMKIGTLIYNTTKKCIEMYLGYYNGAHQWSCDLSGGANTSSASPLTDVAVIPSGFDGVYVAGINLDNTPQRYVKFKIKNNSLFPISNVDFSSAVTLTNSGNVRIVSGQNTSITINGGQERELTYRITGTANEGILKADFSGAGGLTATQQINVLKGNATMSDHIIETLSFDTTQGTIATRYIDIPFTNGLGSYDAVEIDVVAANGEGGDSNGMKLTIPRGTFSASNPTNGIVKARLIVDGDGVYNIKKNVGGIKEDFATFPITLGGTSFNLILRSRSGYEASIEQTATKQYTRNNCGAGYNTTPVDYTKSATIRATSTVSQVNADNESKRLSLAEATRLANITADGQAYANTHGVCTSSGRANIADYNHTPIISFDTTQGELRDGLSISIPYTNGVYGGFEAVTTTPVATAQGESGDTNNLTLNIAKGTYSNGSGTLTATIKVDGDLKYLVKKTEGDNNGYTIATIPVTMSTGETFNVILKAKGGWRATQSHTETRRFTRTNCGSNYTAGSATYTATTSGTATSTISKADAEQKALNNAKSQYTTDGQAWVNAGNATCTYNPPSSGGGGSSGGGSGGGFIRREYSCSDYGLRNGVSPSTPEGSPYWGNWYEISRSICSSCERSIVEQRNQYQKYRDYKSIFKPANNYNSEQIMCEDGTYTVSHFLINTEKRTTSESCGGRNCR